DYGGPDYSPVAAYKELLWSPLSAVITDQFLTYLLISAYLILSLGISILRKIGTPARKLCNSLVIVTMDLILIVVMHGICYSTFLSRWYCIRIVLYIPRIERWVSGVYHDRFLIGVLAFQISHFSIYPIIYRILHVVLAFNILVIKWRDEDEDDDM
ncbi:hypothetical protein ACJX0J_008424, partial [Zea mays]